MKMTLVTTSFYSFVTGLLDSIEQGIECRAFLKSIDSPLTWPLLASTKMAESSGNGTFSSKDEAMMAPLESKKSEGTLPMELESTDEGSSVSSTGGGSTEIHYLGVMPLAMIVFYNVSGGPFGMEEAVRSAGFLVSILGFLLFPFIWSIPEALITAELGAAYPEASGGVAWVEEAFGSAAGWQAGFLGWVAGATDSESIHQ